MVPMDSRRRPPPPPPPPPVFCPTTLMMMTMMQLQQDQDIDEDENDDHNMHSCETVNSNRPRVVDILLVAGFSPVSIAVRHRNNWKRSDSGAWAPQE